jgi:hypothetical protein
LPKELPALPGPGLLAFGQSVVLLRGDGAALREFRSQRISVPIGGHGRICLILVTMKRKCAGGDSEDEEHYGRYGRKPFQSCHFHQ